MINDNVIAKALLEKYGSGKELTIRDFSDQTEAMKQMKLRGHDRAKKRQERMSASDSTGSRQIIEWCVSRVLPAIEEQFESRKNKRGQKPHWYILLQDVPYEDLANIAVRTTVDAAAGGWSFNEYCMELGAALQGQVYAQMVREHLDETEAEARFAKARWEDYKKVVKQSAFDMTRRVSFAKWYAEKKGWITGIDEWSPENKINAMSLCYLTLAQQCHEVFTFMVMVDLETNKRDYNPKARVVRFTEEAEKLFSDKNEKQLWRTPDFSPMTSPPAKWGQPPYRGPYNDPAIGLRVPLVRNAHPPQQAALGEAIEDGSMQEVLDSLNYLQEVPLSLNNYVLEAVLWAWEDYTRHEAIDGFPALRDPGVVTKYPDDDTAYSRHERRALGKKIKRETKRKNTVKSNLVSFKDDIEEALGLVDLEQFFLPYNLDTRSRIYHVSKFGHHRADYMRAMIQFANGAPLDETNIKKIYHQLAGTWKNQISDTDKRKTDKVPMEERYKWVKDNRELLELCGEDFSDPKAFAHWSQADEPFQHLAACRELYNYKVFGPGYVCHLPIGYDGTNSGLQHYSGLLLSADDGAKVNLVPSDTPEDIYEYVAQAATELVQADADGDDERKAHLARLWLKHGIDRKVVKRNTMVFAYNSNTRGMQDQILEDTMEKINNDFDRDGGEHPFIDEQTSFDAARYLGPINMRAIRSVISSADEGLKYVKRLCGIMYRHGHHMKWVTEVGFPVFQHKVQEARHQINTPFYNQPTAVDPEGSMVAKRDFNVNLTRPTEQINVRKSRNGIAPSFIHSLDATHLMMTANKCRQNGVENLLVVHDCFSTDVANADFMNECIRVAFIELYRDRNHLEDLMGYCYQALLDDENISQETIDNIRWPAVPDQQTLEIMKVLDCLYAFS